MELKSKCLATFPATGPFASGFFIADEWLATHCHLPFGILIQGSVHRETITLASTGLAIARSFLRSQVPVTTAAFPYTATFMDID